MKEIFFFVLEHLHCFYFSLEHDVRLKQFQVGQTLITIGHCPMTDTYFPPCKRSFVQAFLPVAISEFCVIHSVWCLYIFLLNCLTITIEITVSPSQWIYVTIWCHKSSQFFTQIKFAKFCSKVQIQPWYYCNHGHIILRLLDILLIFFFFFHHK